MKRRYLAFMCAGLALLQMLSCDRITVRSDGKVALYSETVLPDGVSLALYHFNGCCFEGVVEDGSGAVQAAPSGGKGRYEFNPGKLGDSDWYPLAPYGSQGIRLQDDAARVLLELSPVQFPCRSACDPALDFFAGLPFDIVGGESHVSGFKRMFAPLNVNVIGMPESLVGSVTLSFDFGDSELAGCFYTGFPRVGAAPCLAGVLSGSGSSCVTAGYVSPLTLSSGTFSSCFLLNPCTVPAGTAVRICIQAGKSLYTKTFCLSENLVIDESETAVLSVDMGDETVERRESVLTFMTGLKSASGDVSLKASDGCAYKWSISASAGSDGLEMSSSSAFVIPTLPGKRVKAVRIYSSPSTYGSVFDGDAILSLVSASGNTLASYAFNRYSSNAAPLSLNKQGGILEIPLPEKYETMSGMKIYSGDRRKKIIAGVALVVEGEGIAPGELKADGDDVNTYELIRNCGYNYECPDYSGAHSSSPFRHITQTYDSSLDRYVFNFILHVDNDDDRGLPDVKDRQRNEIKTDNQSPAEMVAQEGETLRISWKFRLPEGMKTSANFSHIHQLKGIDNTSGTADVSAPLLTFTARTKSSGRQVLQLIYRAPGDSSNDYLLDDVPLNDFLGQWVSVTETVTFSKSGTYSVKCERLSDGKTLFVLDGASRDFRRDGARGFRPKWGLYRYLGDGLVLASQLRDEVLQFTDFKIEKM